MNDCSPIEYNDEFEQGPFGLVVSGNGGISKIGYTKPINKNWQIVPVIPTNYIPDDQEIAEMNEIEDIQNSCKHENFNDEDGCPDCGYYSK